MFKSDNSNFDRVQPQENCLNFRSFETKYFLNRILTIFHLEFVFLHKNIASTEEFKKRKEKKKKTGTLQHEKV